ncbi:MAG: hypothetical protein FRC54_03295 [bacterium LCO1.1]|uniref:Transposase IS66 central domain-containing protein n=1 Tax=Candidatus Weimeria bifida TaxID=2599074 RepID=A0A6N7IXF6_9FIRM|nr:hypothetical protein [Candidatus Weimeria bifida]
MLKEDGRRAQTQSFLWCFRMAMMASSDHPVPLFTNKKRRCRQRISEGFNGFLETDGYQAITKCRGSSGVPLGTPRRIFIDAIPKGKQFDYSQPCSAGS